VLSGEPHISAELPNFQFPTRLAIWPRFGASKCVHKLPGTATSTTSVTKALPARLTTPVNITGLNTDTANSKNSQTHSSDAQKQAPSPTSRVLSEDKRPQIAARSAAGRPGQVSLSQGSQQQILIKSRGPSWVVACADGKEVFEKLIQDGDTDRFNFSIQALLHAGNGGALDITFNSKPLRCTGQPGNIRAWRFSREGYTDLAPALNRSCEIL
jgi:uncharacterized protein DUF4115